MPCGAVVPTGIHPVDITLIDRPGLQLRLAVTALRAGVLRYVTESGVIVEEDAVTPVAGVAAGPVDVLEGALASASVPVVFPPRPLADDDYVDGGVLQNVPVRAALHLGASRIIAVLAIPLHTPREEHNFATDQAANIGLRALGVISLADRQRENLGIALTAGASLTTIDPVVDVVGFFEAEVGLLRINRDYGWLRAADVMAEGDPTLRAGIAAQTHQIAEARLRAWHTEEKLWGSSPRAGTPKPGCAHSSASARWPSATWWTSVSSWDSPCPTGAKSGGPNTRCTTPSGRRICRPAHSASRPSGRRANRGA